MVTVAEAQAQVESARTELKGATTQAQTRQAEIKLAKAESQQRLQQRTRIGTISSQLALAEQVGRGGVRGEIGRRRVTARKEFRETGRRITRARRELTTFEEQLAARELEISGVERQIVSAKAQEAEQAAIRSDIESAKKIVRGVGFDPGASPRVKKFIREIRAGQEIAVTKDVREAAVPTLTEIELQMSLPTSLRDLPPSEIISRQSLAPISIQPVATTPKGILIADITDITKTPREFIPIQTLASGGVGGLIQEDIEEPTPVVGFAERIGIPKIVRESFTGGLLAEERARSRVAFEGRRFQFSFVDVGKRGSPFGVTTTGEPTFQPGTPAFEAEVERETRRNILGAQLQSAFFLSFAGIRTPIPRTGFRIPTRPARQPTFVEIQQPLIISGRPTTISSFRITREITPPTFVASRTEGLLGGAVRPPRFEVTTTPFKIIDKLPTFTLTTRGAGIGRLDVLRGTSQPTSVLELGAASPTQRLLFQRFAEDVAGTRPVAIRNIPRVLRRDLGFDIGELQTFRLGRIDVGRRPTEFRLLEPRTLGRRRTQFETLSQFRKIKETEQFQFFKGTTFFKETIRAFPRAAGRTPQLRGIVIRRREPIVIGEDAVESFQFVGGRTTPLAKTFTKQFEQQRLQLLPKPPPTPRPRRAALKTQRPTRVSGISSLLVGVSGRVSTRPSSDFDLDFGGGFKGGGITRPTTAKREERQFGRLVQFQPQITLGRQVFPTTQRLAPLARVEQRQFPKQTEIGGLQFRELVIQRRALRQTQKLQQRQKLASKLKLAQKQTFKSPAPARPLKAFRIGKPLPKTLAPIVFDLPRRALDREKKKRPKGRRLRPPIRPGFTGIIVEGIGLPETTTIQGIDIGVLPRRLRGLVS